MMKARHITARPEMGRLGPIGQRDTDTVAVGCRNRNSETTTKRARGIPVFQTKGLHCLDLSRHASLSVKKRFVGL